MKRWTIIFKALGNVNRLKIIELLSRGALQQNVGEIARQIHVTYRGTSQHLIMLYRLDILGNEGRNGHVYYFLNRKMPRDLQKAISLFL